MAVDTWPDTQETMAERAAGVARSTLIALFWMTLVAGPPIVGGVIGWLVTYEGEPGGPITGLLGQLPAETANVLVTREEVEAVGLDPRDVEAILNH